MIVVMEPGVTPGRRDAVREALEALGGSVVRTGDATQDVFVCVSNPRLPDPEVIARLPGVARVDVDVTPFPLASRAVRPSGTRFPLGTVTVGAGDPTIIAGPCSVEDRDGFLSLAEDLAKAGAHALRGGAFKPRTSPYTFQGLGMEGLEILGEARRRTALPVVTEVTDPRQIEAAAAHADVLQVGARNMYNYELLKELGRTRRPLLVKRGPSATVSDFLQAVEYVLLQGADRVMLCERGIRTFETATRNTLDLGGVAVLKRETHLPVIVDPSHAAGRRELVAPLALAAVAAGADGLMMEVHPCPDRALTDREQQLTLEAFTHLVQRIRRVAGAAAEPVAPRRAS